jgi:4-hydroxyacetophenone monooxygenase
MKISEELATATDADIEDCVASADPLILLGLVYQLTGDEELSTMELKREPFGYSHLDSIKNPSDIALLRKKAVDLLKSYRGLGAGKKVGPGPAERLPRSLSLIAGGPIPDSEMEMWIEETGIDPLARGLKFKGNPTPEQLANFKVGVIGSGLSGLNAAVHLKAAGIPFVIIEKNPEVGGTWYENQYPGARVDSPSRGYLHLFGLEFPYPYAFCPRDENLRYMRWVSERFGIREDIVFNTEVQSMIWDEDSQKWDIHAEGPSGPQSWQVNAVISCVGFLSRPSMPTIPGMETFEGTACHTARWPEGLDVAGKKVAVIGSGASGYQTTPVIAKTAAHTYLFQRTPSWCYATPSYVSPLPDQLLWLDRNFPYYVNFARFRLARTYGPDNTMLSQRIDPAFEDPHTRSPTNKAMRNECISFLSKQLAGRPDLIAKMTPVAPPMSSRPIRIDPEDNIYAALMHDNVTLVSDPITRITPKGIEVDGVEYPLDIIAYATGFRANDFLWPMEVRGRDGARIEDLWAKDGPRAYIGSMLPGFPNFFMAYGPNTNNFGGLQIIDLLEIEIRFALQCIAGLIEGDGQSVSVTPDAYWRFNEELDREERTMIYTDPRVFNYYKNEHGRSCVNGPIDYRRMWHWLRDPAGAPPEKIDAGMKPYFGGDLVLG